MEQQKSQNCQSNPEEKNRASDRTFPDFRRYYKVLEIKTAWHWHISRHVDLNGESRNKPTLPQSSNLRQRRKQELLSMWARCPHCFH